VEVRVVDRDGVRCARCGTALPRGEFAAPRPDRFLECLACAELGDLVLLESGDAALTRRAAALSKRSAPLLSWNRRRKRDERRGTFVEAPALEAARAACAADAGERAERAAKRRVKDAEKDRAYVAAFQAAVREAFPGCPPAEAAAIAAHACEKHSGRVGRAAFAKELDPEAVELAVRAHVRHVHTGYDGLRDAGLNQRESRPRVRGEIDAVLSRWRRP
jgi:hypothetical protein